MSSLPPTTPPIAATASLTLRDGLELFYRAWHPESPARRALILFHGGHEHSGRFQELVEALALEETAVFAWDARGHGRSAGERGHADHFMALVRDADEFVRHIGERHGIPLEEMVVMGHSVGSVVAATWVHDFAPPVRGMVLGSPALRVKLYIPFALPGLRLIQRLRPDAFVNSYVRPSMLTHDRDEAEARRRDTLISPKIAVRVLTSLFDSAERLIEGAHSITVPTLILSAGSDHVVHREAQRRLFERLGSRDKRFKTLPGFYHELFHERERHQPIHLARGFILECFQAPRPPISSGPSVDEGNRDTHAALARPLPLYAPSRWGYAAARLALATAGRLSEGIRIGWRHGFDSGPMLDYVYRDRADGITPLGRAIDRAYLAGPGWRGIRTRGRHLVQLLSEEIARRTDRPVRIVDVAAGGGRYVLEALEASDHPDLAALCRDRDPQGLAEGQANAAARGIANVRFEPGDAFDPASIAAIEPAPDIVVVSGLYELFDDNTQVERSLRALHARMKPGATLIYTNQPHHPQLALIARVLDNRDGERWVMRPRPQMEMNALARAAGFTPRRMLIDDRGIFSVTVARREG